MKKLEMKRKQQGFTIIELVVVILLLGILTATALPRFIDVTDDAHDAAVSGVLGGVGTGAALFRAQWFADGQPSRVTEFGNLVANASGYPIGIISGTLTSTIRSSVGSSENCAEVFQNVLQLAGQPTITSELSAATLPGSLTTLSSAFDYVAYVRNTAKNVCYYFYTGQFTNPSTQAVPAIIYDAATGSVTVADQ